MVGYGRMNNTPTASQLSVRSCCLILVMILSSMTPIASAQNVAPKFAGATLSENPEDAPLTYSFSPAIRAAFARVSDLSQYSESELESTSKWVVVSSNPIGEATGILANTWYVEVDPSDSLQYFSNLQDSGEIEVAYPLVKRQMTPKWIPNDSYFTDQWHLQIPDKKTEFQVKM